MGQLRDRMRQDLELRGRRPNTIATYLRCARQFAAHFHRSPAEMGAEELRQFMLYLREQRKLAPASLIV